MSIVRENLMSRKGYTPYCGNVDCRFHMPRTRYIAGQFQCGCGWRSSFDDAFIEAYEAKWADPSPETNVVATDDLRKRVMRAIFDPGATEGFKGDRDLTTWQTDAVMRALATTEGSAE